MMSTLDILEVITSRKNYIILSLMIFISLITMAPVVSDEEYDVSDTLAVSHSLLSTYDDEGNNLVRGIIYIKNLGTSPAYVLGITQYIQSDHSPQWISIVEDEIVPLSSVEDAIVIPADGYYKIGYSTVFSPEENVDYYRNRIEVLVLNSEGTSTSYLSDYYFSLPEAPPPTQPPTTEPPTTVPPTTVPPTTEPPTTAPPTTEPPTTAPPTTEPPTTAPPTTEPPTTEPPTTEPPTTSAPEIDIGQGYISNIEADICQGGTAVCVELTVTSGSFTQSSLQLVITSQDEESWKRVYEECLALNVGGEGMTVDNTPLLFCFEDILLSGDVETYNICVTWKQGLTCERNAPVISRQCTDCHSIPTLDYMTYAVIISTLLIIGAYFLRKVAKE